MNRMYDFIACNIGQYFLLVTKLVKVNCYGK